MSRWLIPLVLVASPLLAQTNQAIADFEQPDLKGWSTSMSPEYYRGNTGQQGLQVVKDAERGNVLAADVRFVDAGKSEPCFITYQLPKPLPLAYLRTVSFWYKLALAPTPSPSGRGVPEGRGEGLESFKVRLRTSDTSFNDYDVTPVFGKWQHCVIDTKTGGNLVNVWGKVFGEVKQLTFRLDDIDNRNTQFTLLVDDVVASVAEPTEQAYTPQPLRLQRDDRLDVLLIHHAAASASTYWLDPAWRTLDPQFRLRSYPFKGLHFGLDLFGFPPKLEGLLNTDLIVLVDVDPFTMTPEQAAWLADLTYSGTGLVFFAGGNTLANSKGFKRPLADVLPVTFKAGDPQYVSRKVSLGTPHFVSQGLDPSGLGLASTVQKLTPREGATVVLKGDDRPLVTVGEFGQGRVAIINAQPNLDRDDDLFASPAGPALVQRTLQWVLHRETQQLAAMPAERDLPPATPPQPSTLNRTDFFPLITMVGGASSGHYLSETDLRREVEKVKAAGFNTVAVGGLSGLTRPQDKPSAGTRNIWALQRLAREMGLATIFEYTSFNRVSGAEPNKPCVFSPEYPQALADKLNPQIDVAQRTPNLLSVKILDEPTVSPKAMDYCEHCQRVFRERYGIPLRKFEEIPADATYERWAFADFEGFYVAEGYRQAWELKQKSGAQFDLLITYMSTALGYGRGINGQEDGLDWGRWADRMDFDVYPYFYPASQKIRMVQAAWCMAYMRQLSQHLKKPWGFYVELDDRNWPFQQNPREASAECACEALLHGADYLNSFIHLPFATGCDSRPERWDWTAQELRKVNALGPLLTKLARQPAPVAFLYPTAQTFATDQGAPKPYAYACVSQGFGNVDVLPEEVALEQKTLKYRALLLLGCDILHADMAPLLQQWVREGGTLILDKLPTKNHKGEALQWPVTFADGAAEPQSRALGKGRVVLLGCDPEAAYKDAIENEKPAEAAKLRALLAKLLAPAKPRAVVLDKPAQMEVGVRQSRDMALVIVVNHDAKPNEGTVTVRDLGFKPAWAQFLFQGKSGMAPAKLTTAAGAHSFTVKLPARQAALVLLAPKQPAGLPTLAQ
ncbi:hypothetical protein LLH23_12165 [bacterium]|nr:hypothetical protein [bacterium]